MTAIGEREEEKEEKEEKEKKGGGVEVLTPGSGGEEVRMLINSCSPHLAAVHRLDRLLSEEEVNKVLVLDRVHEIRA